MKMPENMTVTAILAAKEQGIRQSLRLQWRTFAAGNGGAFTKTVIDANDVRHYRLVCDLLDFAGLSSNLAYITSVFIGHIGTDSIGSLIKRFAAKKLE